MKRKSSSIKICSGESCATAPTKKGKAVVRSKNPGGPCSNPKSAHPGWNIGIGLTADLPKGWGILPRGSYGPGRGCNFRDVQK